MARVVVADAASLDEATVLGDLKAKAGLPTALKFRAEFRNLYDRLAAHPEIGAPRPGFGRNIRIGIVSPYIIIYRYEAETDTVTVIRIVHGRRRISGDLLSDTN